MEETRFFEQRQSLSSLSVLNILDGRTVCIRKIDDESRSMG